MIWVLLTTLKLLTEIPPPALTAVAPVRFAPFKVTETVEPRVPELGPMELKLGAEFATCTEIGNLWGKQGAPFTHPTVTVAVRVAPGVKPAGFTVRVIEPDPEIFSGESAEVVSHAPLSVLVVVWIS